MSVEADFSYHVSDGYEIIDRSPPMITIRIPMSPQIGWDCGRPANPTLAILDGDEVLAVATIRSVAHHFTTEGGKTDLELLLNV